MKKAEQSAVQLHWKREAEERRGRWRGQRDWKRNKELTTITGFGNGRRDPRTKECRLSLEAENDPLLTISKEMGPSVLQLNACEKIHLLPTLWFCPCETLSREPADHTVSGLLPTKCR